MKMSLRRLLSAVLSAICILSSQARHQILTPNIKTLQVVVGQQWTSNMPVMQLHSTDILHISFDELSHNYHRFAVHVEPCNPDWTPCEGLFESDWLEGFNDLTIEDYENSVNTTVLYTHYQYQLPNDQMRLKLSGNYRIHIIDEDDDKCEVLCAEFRVVEPLMNVGLSVTTNTDVGHNNRYQQVSMTLNYNNLRVTDLNSEIQTFVFQNGREDTMKDNPRPNYITPKGLRWEHNRELIFDGGNEYHKYEMLDVSHPTMGLEHMVWDEDGRHYHAYPFQCEPRRSYIYDEDANGAFYIRNSDNQGNNTMSDYVMVHYKLAPARCYDEDARIIIDGQWANESADVYQMSYNPSDQSYNATILQKQGYYNYQLLLQDAVGGAVHVMPEEGSFYQTENNYQGLVYYRPTGARSWRLVGYQDIKFK